MSSDILLLNLTIKMAKWHTNMGTIAKNVKEYVGTISLFCGLIHEINEFFWECNQILAKIFMDVALFIIK